MLETRGCRRRPKRHEAVRIEVTTSSKEGSTPETVSAIDGTLNHGALMPFFALSSHCPANDVVARFIGGSSPSNSRASSAALARSGETKNEEQHRQRQYGAAAA